MNDDTTELLGFPIVSTDALPDEGQGTHALPILGDLSCYDRLAGMTAQEHSALADAPLSCPACGASDPQSLGVAMRVHQAMPAAALVPNDPTVATFWWCCNVCGLRWRAPSRAVVDMYLRALQRLSDDKAHDAGATVVITLAALPDLAADQP